MSSIIDIVASLTLRGAIVIAVLNMTIALQGKLSEKTAQANMFSLITTVSRVIANDLNMVNYTGNFAALSAPYVTYASKDTIEITYRDPSSGTQTWVKYFAGSRSELSNTSNPKDRKLYRAQGTIGAGVATASVLAIGVDSLQIIYYDGIGTTLTPPVNKSLIKAFKIYLVMATGDKINNLYPSAEWTFRFWPSNIN